MDTFLGKCGCDCGRCPSYKENLVTAEDRARTSRGWEKYFAIRLKPEKLRPCDGCSIPDEKRRVFYLNCRVRKCAGLNGIENCAYCSAYPCPDVQTIHSVQGPDAIRRIEERIDGRIPEADYRSIVEPYEGIKHLDALRGRLKPGDIVEMTPVSKTPRIVPFPDGWAESDASPSAFRQLHAVIASVEVETNISHARHIVLEKNRRQILKLLWAFGVYGEFDKDGTSLILRSEDYAAQKISTYQTRVEEFIAILGKHGLECRIVPTVDKGWKTPTGALRKTGWHLKLSPGKKISGAFSRALRVYTNRLEDEFGKNAFRTFAAADMRQLAVPS